MDASSVLLFFLQILAAPSFSLHASPPPVSPLAFSAVPSLLRSRFLASSLKLYEFKSPTPSQHFQRIEDAFERDGEVKLQRGEKVFSPPPPSLS
ncbi:hypothetical protein SCHPADRAFT_947333 [Schizopora paradoxa]|uniref:Uncharacterized protein n=1 Tax=Schizopora paradoxa TaxID=27342 RepID=A0A0H2RJJ2_9AGAM|nr:hypothetical protein SCHPADRAFT_947333 [Schizopora paradoxa]